MSGGGAVDKRLAQSIFDAGAKLKAEAAENEKERRDLRERARAAKKVAELASAERDDLRIKLAAAIKRGDDAERNLMEAREHEAELRAENERLRGSRELEQQVEWHRNISLGCANQLEKYREGITSAVFGMHDLLRALGLQINEDDPYLVNLDETVDAMRRAARSAPTFEDLAGNETPSRQGGSADNYTTGEPVEPPMEPPAYQQSKYSAKRSAEAPCVVGQPPEEPKRRKLEEVRSMVAHPCTPRTPRTPRAPCTPRAPRGAWGAPPELRRWNICFDSPMGRF